MVGICAHADSPDPDDALDKTYWSSLDEKAKPAFLMGFRFGAGRKAFERSPTVYDLPPSRLGFDSSQIPKLVPRIDLFYKDPNNAEVYLRSAIEICLMQLTGQAPEEIAQAMKKAREFKKY